MGAAFAVGFAVGTDLGLDGFLLKRVGEEGVFVLGAEVASLVARSLGLTGDSSCFDEGEDGVSASNMGKHDALREAPSSSTREEPCVQCMVWMCAQMCVCVCADLLPALPQHP